VAAIMALPRPSSTGVRYSRADQCHVTLRFLGNASIDAAVRALAQVLAPAVDATIGPKVVRLGRQVVCLPVSGLDVLAEAVVRSTGHVGRPPEQRPFRAHLTIARLGRSSPRVLANLLDVPLAAHFAVSEILLVRSTLDHRGARYDTLASRSLLARM
jgi:2'-5' RNA ligase